MFASGWRRRHETGSNPAIVLASLALTAVVLAFFAVGTLRNAPQTFVAIIVVALVAIVLDAIPRRAHRSAEDVR